MSAERPLEPGIVRDFTENLSYGRYLHLDELLAAQHPLSRPEHHDELLFVIQHQTSELWLKLALHELATACEDLAHDDLPLALKRLARVKHVQRQLIEQWSVLATLTPSEYGQFRGFLGTSSGFQSYQYRAVEFVLGNKNAELLALFADDPTARRILTDALDLPGDLRRPAAVLGRLRGLRGARRHRGERPALALPAPQDRRADHRVPDRDRWLERRGVPAPRPRAHLLPRALRRADGAVVSRGSQSSSRSGRSATTGYWPVISPRASAASRIRSRQRYHPTTSAGTITTRVATVQVPIG
jgi:hypothetical protein